jgi:hypothetical protein
MRCLLHVACGVLSVARWLGSCCNVTWYKMLHGERCDRNRDRALRARARVCVCVWRWWWQYRGCTHSGTTARAGVRSNATTRCVACNRATQRTQPRGTMQSVRGGSCSPTACNMQRAASQRALGTTWCDRRPTACSMQHAACSRHHLACNKDHAATHHLEHAAYSMRTGAGSMRMAATLTAHAASLPRAAMRVGDRTAHRQAPAHAPTASRNWTAPR